MPYVCKKSLDILPLVIIGVGWSPQCCGYLKERRTTYWEQSTFKSMVKKRLPRASVHSGWTRLKHTPRLRRRLTNSRILGVSSYSKIRRQVFFQSLDMTWDVIQEQQQYCNEKDRYHYCISCKVWPSFSATSTPFRGDAYMARGCERRGSDILADSRPICTDVNRWLIINYGKKAESDSNYMTLDK